MELNSAAAPETLEVANCLDAVKRAVLGLVGCARVYCISIPRSASVSVKVNTARQAWLQMQSAVELHENLRQFYGFRDELRSAYTSEGAALARTVAGAPESEAEVGISRAKSAAMSTLHQAQIAASHELFAPIRISLDRAFVSLDAEWSTPRERYLPEVLQTSQALDACLQSVRGPIESILDPAFDQAASPDEAGNPPFDGEPTDTLRFLWTLAAREGMASDLAALNSAEYDNMPIAYYEDFVKQTWDEARHCNFYLGILPEVYEILKDQIPEGAPERLSIERFLQEGIGLEIPYEGTCYTSIWNASLEERLVLMNLRTEGPSISTKRKRMQGFLCSAIPRLRLGIAIDACEERNHAAYGARWLRYLHPEPRERRDQIECADSLRGFLMATTLAGRRNIATSLVMEELLNVSLTGLAPV